MPQTCKGCQINHLRPTRHLLILPGYCNADASSLYVAPKSPPSSPCRFLLRGASRMWAPILERLCHTHLDSCRWEAAQGKGPHFWRFRFFASENSSSFYSAWLLLQDSCCYWHGLLCHWHALFQPLRQCCVADVLEQPVALHTQACRAGNGMLAERHNSCQDSVLRLPCCVRRGSACARCGGSRSALLDWQELRDADEHTPASLQDLAVAGPSQQLTSTAYSESTHHSVKSHASFTNNRPQLLNAQILEHFRLKGAVRAALDDSHIKAKSSKSLANKAAQSGKIVIGTSKQRRSPQSLCTVDRPDLSDFPAALAAFLHLSDDSGIQVNVTDSLAIPMSKHRGSGDEGLILRATKVCGEDRAERFDIIIVRGEEDGQLWYGQLRLIFSVRRPSDWDLQHCVYVRWLKETTVHTEARVAVGLPCVGCKTRRRGGVLVPRQDVVEIDRTCGPAYLQEDPSARGLFFVNRYIV